MANLGRFDADNNVTDSELGIHIIVIFDVVHANLLRLDYLIFPETPALSLVSYYGQASLTAQIILFYRILDSNIQHVKSDCSLAT